MLDVLGGPMKLIGVRLAPGVRVSVSTRGVRAHVGPRAARLHVGSGRTGVSTGAGPVTYYTSIGGSSRRRSTPAPVRVTASTPAQQEKAELAVALAQQIEVLQTRHKQVSFPLMQRPVADLPAPSAGQTMKHHLKLARAGVPWYDLKGRLQARMAAKERATADDRQAQERAELDRRNRQEELDSWWRQLMSNEPATVMAFVQQAFEDNDDPAAIVGVEGDEAYVAVLAPDDSDVPDRMPGVTPTGRPSIRKMPAKNAALLHRQVVAGTLLVTLMETFAVAPGLASVKIAALERGRTVSFLWSVRVRRTELDRVLRSDDTSLEIIESVADENNYRLTGGARRLGPMDAGTIGWSELEEALLSRTEEEFR